MQIRPGPKAATGFIRECAKEVARCVVEEFGSQAYLDGKQCLVVFDPEDEEKFGLGEGLQMTGQTISVVWMHEDKPDVRSGATLAINAREYKIKKGYPILQSACLCYAELDDCGGC